MTTRWILPFLVLGLLGASPNSEASPVETGTRPSATEGVINGIVKDRAGQPLENALVILQCTCLSAARETKTNARGLYVFRDLPAGRFTIQVLHGKANVSKVATLPRNAKFRANFSVDPKSDFTRRVVVDARPRRSKYSSTGRRMDMEQVKNIPVGRHRSRDFTTVVDLAPGSRAPGNRAPDGWNRESYRRIDEGGWNRVPDRPLSTFSIDVDTASYSNVRRFLDSGSLPPKDAVRIEELINYFDYDAPPVKAGRPFTVATEVGPSPWKAGNKLVRVKLQAKTIDIEHLPPRNLVFLIDVSGSMQSELKLALLKRSLTLLVDQLRREDHVALVVYAGAAGTVLPPTSGADKHTIREAINRLEAGGSTNGAEGIEQAYRLARAHFDEKGINRVVLGTDGDFNVGVTSHGDLTRLIETKRESGVFLSVLGFGMGNLQDDRMEALADRGNGNYAYIDSLVEAQKVLVKESGGTLVTVAKDVKLQVEFNPTRVAKYRLVGYENRKLKAKDFDDDKKDAGELGAGHDVTALYEITPATPARAKRARRLRYQSDRSHTTASAGDELLEVKVRFKAPKARRSQLERFVVRDRNVALSRTSHDFRFAVAVASFGMLLRGSKHLGGVDWKAVRDLAQGALGGDTEGYRAEFLGLVRRAETLGAG